VGGVASIWVLPLISYTFGNLPLMSILVTPFIMLLVYAILALGMLLLFLPDVVAEVVYGVVERVAMLHNAVVSRAADTPGFVLYATLNGYEVVAIYIGFVLFSFVVKVWSEKKYLTLLDDEPEYRLQFVDTQHPGGA
jgi:competence protein ComEC